MKKTLPRIIFLKKLPLIYGFALFVILNFCFNVTGFAQGAVGIGTLTPDKSAALDVSSTSAGLLVPRMTLAQRNAIATPANGLMIYNTNDLKFNYWNGSKWEEIGGGITWFTGQGQPADMGKVNDLYLDEQTGEIYQRVYDSLNPLVLIWSRFNFNKNNKKQFTLTAKTAPTGYSKQDFTFQGAGTTNAVVCSPSFALPDGVIISHAWVSAPNVISVKFYNTTASPIPLNGSYQIAIF
ncbi:MAG TPA: hypothetical protein VL125_03415 [Pelobium sp.]|nr:hypothetical protein [Pelobium sp.]